jgi:hypothetical protein
MVAVKAAGETGEGRLRNADRTSLDAGHDTPALHLPNQYKNKY